MAAFPIIMKEKYSEHIQNLPKEGIFLLASVAINKDTRTVEKPKYLPPFNDLTVFFAYCILVFLCKALNLLLLSIGSLALVPLLVVCEDLL